MSSRVHWRAGLLVALVLSVGIAPAQEDAATVATRDDAGPYRRTWNFHGEGAGDAPDGFGFESDGASAKKKWAIRQVPGAPSGSNVLAPPSSLAWSAALAKEPAYKDVNLSVKVQFAGEARPGGAGLLLRWQNVSNYYRISVDPESGELVLVLVYEGRASELASAQVGVTPGRWHSLGVDNFAGTLQVKWDGQAVASVANDAITFRGQVGLWVSQKTECLFDDLSADPQGR